MGKGDGSRESGRQWQGQISPKFRTTQRTVDDSGQPTAALYVVRHSNSAPLHVELGSAAIGFDETMDGIVYTVVASLGFACIEKFVLPTSPDS